MPDITIGIGAVLLGLVVLGVLVGVVGLLSYYVAALTEPVVRWMGGSHWRTLLAMTVMGAIGLGAGWIMTEGARLIVCASLLPAVMGARLRGLDDAKRRKQDSAEVDPRLYPRKN